MELVPDPLYERRDAVVPRRGHAQRVADGDHVAADLVELVLGKQVRDLSAVENGVDVLEHRLFDLCGTDTVAKLSLQTRRLSYDHEDGVAVK